MRYRRLGNAGVKLSEIGLGGWLTFGNAMSEEVAKAIMDRAFDLGINFFDTADAYAKGRCEEVWGKLLKPRRRSSYVLATKVFFPIEEGPNSRGLSRKHIMEACHGSLRRLGVDYLDLYQCHTFDDETPVEETIRAMDDLVRHGKVLYWGFSEWPVEMIEQTLRICARGYEAPRVSQPCYNLIQRDIEAQVMPLCLQAGIGHVVYSPLAQGILSGKYKPGEAAPAGSRGGDARQQNKPLKALLADDALLERVRQLRPVAADAGCTLAQFALAWILRRTEVTSCITGASRLAQLEENARVSELELPAQAIERAEEILANKT